jgi:hypothetical protein
MNTGLKLVDTRRPGDVHIKICQVVVWCLWTILPPSYFLFEYWIFTNAYPPPKIQFYSLID